MKEVEGRAALGGSIEVVFALKHELRGIRQRDPLSPFLFLLCFEGLNGLINKVVIDGKMRSFSLCKNGPKISHLFLQMTI